MPIRIGIYNILILFSKEIQERFYLHRFALERIKYSFPMYRKKISVILLSTFHHENISGSGLLIFINSNKIKT